MQSTPRTRSLAVYFDEARTCGIIVADPAELTAKERDGAEKVVACAIGFKAPEISAGPSLFLLDPEEAKVLAEKLLFFAAEKTS